MDQASTLRHIVSHQKARATTPRAQPSRMRVVAVTSGKGGVGKTNIVLNLCMALSRLDRRVFLLDADMGLANVDVLLGLTPEFTLEHVLNGQKEIQDVVLTAPGGFRILPSSSGISELAEMTYEQQMHLFSVLSGIGSEIDYLFIDTGAGISSNVLRFNASASEVIVVANPEPTAITDAYALMKLLSIKDHLREFSLIANSVNSEADGNSVYRRLNQVCTQYLNVKLSFLGSIPYDKAVRKAVRLQNPVLSSFPTAPASRSLLQIAHRLEQRAPAHPVPARDSPPLPAEGAPSGFWDRLLHWQKVK